MSPRVDVLVVGGGYWGIAIAYEARAAGRSVRVLDDADPRAGSPNASAIAHFDTYGSPIFSDRWPAEWGKQELAGSLEWLVRVAGARETPEVFLNLTRPDLPPRRAQSRPPFYLKRNGDLLDLVPKERARLRAAAPDAGGWEADAGLAEPIRARALVLAGGYRTDELLAAVGEKPLGVVPLFGRGLVARGLPTVPVPSMLMTRPYTKFALRPWGEGSYRFGDTAEIRQNDARADELRALARGVLGGFEEVGWMTGLRPVLPQYTLAMLRGGPAPLIVATGGHRMALGLAGLVAVRAMKMLA